MYTKLFKQGHHRICEQQNSSYQLLCRDFLFAKTSFGSEGRDFNYFRGDNSYHFHFCLASQCETPFRMFAAGGANSFF